MDRRQRPAAPAPADPEPQLAALVERHRSGDPAALNALMTALYPSIYRIVYRLAGPRDREQHEDLVQSSLEQVCRCIDAFEGRSRVSTFVFGICHRVVRALAPLRSRAQLVPPRRRGGDAAAGLGARPTI